MTSWVKNESDGSRRRCVLNVAALADGSWAPLATDLTGLLKIRLGGVAWTDASGTLTNSGFDGHWVYEGTQAEANSDTNEIELRIVDATWYAQTLVAITPNIAAQVTQVSSGGRASSGLSAIARWMKAESVAAKRRVLIEARFSDGVLADPRLMFEAVNDLLADPSSGVRAAAAGTIASVREPLTVADFDFSTTHADDLVNATAHGRKTGDGPFTLTTSGGLPAGYLPGTNYWWIWKSDDTGQWASSRANALAGTAVAITTDGTGTHTAHDVPGTTEQLVDGQWMYEADAAEIDIVGNYFAVILQREATVITISSLAPGVGDTMIVTGTGFLPRHVGRTITIVDGAESVNNGTFTITAVSLDGTEAIVTSDAGSIEESALAIPGTLNDDVPAVTVSVDLYELEFEMDSGMGGKPWSDIFRGNTALQVGRSTGYQTGLITWICPFSGKTRWTHTIIPDGRSVATSVDLEP